MIRAPASFVSLVVSTVKVVDVLAVVLKKVAPKSLNSSGGTADRKSPNRTLISR